MATLNKVHIAAQMFSEAHRRFQAATSDIDYVTSILLSGAVIGIVGPLVKEQGRHTTHELLARIESLLGASGTPIHEGMFRAVYNSLKHTGNERRNISPSQDLVIETGLRREAGYMLEAARDDFRNIEVSRAVRESLPSEFLALVDSEESYA